LTHQCNRFRAQDAGAVELATLQQHSDQRSAVEGKCSSGPPVPTRQKNSMAKPVTPEPVPDRAGGQEALVRLDGARPRRSVSTGKWNPPPVIGVQAVPGLGAQ
jgi:hypothetical protein